MNVAGIGDESVLTWKGIFVDNMTVSYLQFENFVWLSAIEGVFQFDWADFFPILKFL